LPLPGAFAQDKPLALGVGLEGNMNTSASLAWGSWFSASRDLGQSFAAGIKAGYSNDFTGIATLEIAALGRWYFLALGESRFFAQLEAGADPIWYEQQSIPAFLGGLVAGWRLPLGSWYLEPVLRVGYPYIWGAGLGFGWRI
jgi:hypothetical protein